MPEDSAVDAEGPPQVRLLDEGLETPDELVGRTGRVTVEKPDIEMVFTYSGDGVKEISELTRFPTTGEDSASVPEGHIRIEGTLYELVDARDHDECPDCGSDKVALVDDGDHIKCYTCEHEFAFGVMEA